MELTADEQRMIDALREKFARSGQNMVSYLEGLIHARYLTYWDYLHLDTLLSLQVPRTEFPDELIFICYHQITELYFKLIRLELDQLANAPDVATNADLWKLRLKRVVSYFRQLTTSFDTMVDGMDPRQFLHFRMSLLPASGFQSAQFREIELRLTTLHRLAGEAAATLPENTPLTQLYQHSYWKQGGRELATGEKILTLRMFEERYDSELLASAQHWQQRNLLYLFRTASETVRKDDAIAELLRQTDLQANVFWRLAHYRSAVRYLHKNPEDIAATGGTNWQQYLPPRFQRVIFYPDLWSPEQIAEWGKAWVTELFKQQVEANWGTGQKPQQ